jgi:hypothetical protein
MELKNKKPFLTTLASRVHNLPYTFLVAFAIAMVSVFVAFVIGMMLYEKQQNLILPFVMKFVGFALSLYAVYYLSKFMLDYIGFSKSKIVENNSDITIVTGTLLSSSSYQIATGTYHSLVIDQSGIDKLLGLNRVRLNTTQGTYTMYGFSDADVKSLQQKMGNMSPKITVS